MKSLLITLEYPPDIGGVSTYYAHLVKKNPPGAISVLHLKPPKVKFGWMWCLGKIRKKIKKEHIVLLDVGHILPLGYLALILRLTNHLPYRVYIHGLDVLQKMSAWKRWWIQIILQRAQSIVANSQYVKKKVIIGYGIAAEKINVMYPLIDLAEIEKTAQGVIPTRKQGTEKRKIILSVGRLVPRKGIDTTLQALKELSDVRWEYWIIGEGFYRDTLKRITKKLNLQNRVRFLGRVPTPDIYGYYKSADVFIMPSREVAGDVEGFGIVFLEAAVFKLPVIGGHSGGIPEAIVSNETGILVDPNNPKDISEALRKLFDNPDFAHKLGEAGYARVKNEFSL